MGHLVLVLAALLQALFLGLDEGLLLFGQQLLLTVLGLVGGLDLGLGAGLSSLDLSARLTAGLADLLDQAH